jgi:aspartyl-tRNA(Asn)/glutamyl-tRNA(Gln) amidotransferase subunit C
MITEQQVLHIARLAKLELSDEEVTKYKKELSKILEYVSQIDNVDVDNIDNLHHLSDYRRTVLQEDKINPFKQTKKLFQNATDGRFKNGFIRTSKIVNKE